MISKPQVKTRKPLSTRKKLIFSFLSFFVVTLVICVVVEVSLRLAWHNAKDEVFMERMIQRIANSAVSLPADSDSLHPHFGAKLSVNARKSITTDDFSYLIETNSQGFRTREFSRKVEGEYRVILLGDSMFFGVGCEPTDCIPAILESLADADSEVGRDLRVFNCSIPDYNTVQELQIARVYFGGLEPNHVVLGFFLANDLIPNYFAGVNEKGHYFVSEERKTELKGEVRKSFSFLWHSMIARFLGHTVFAPRLRYELAGHKEIFEASLLRLLEARDLCSELGCRFTVVILYSAGATDGGFEEWWAPSRPLGRKLADACRQEKLEVIDMLDFMEGSAARASHMWPRDKHFTPAGNRLVANVIFENALSDRLKER